MKRKWRFCVFFHVSGKKSIFCPLSELHNRRQEREACTRERNERLFVSCLYPQWWPWKIRDRILSAVLHLITANMLRYELCLVQLLHNSIRIQGRIIILQCSENWISCTEGMWSLIEYFSHKNKSYQIRQVELSALICGFYVLRANNDQIRQVVFR